MKIDPEFQALIAPLQPDEREQLEANLVAHGCRDPLVLWCGLLIDGHNRFEICTRLKIKYHTVEMALPTREYVLLWIEENQLGRRNLTDDQRTEITDSVAERREAMRRAEHQREAGTKGGRGRPKSRADTVSARLPSRDRSLDSRPTAAKQARVPERKLRSIREIKRKLKDSGGLRVTLAAIRAGTKTIAQVKRELRTAEREERIEQAMKITAIPDPARCVLLHSDLAEAALDPESVDAIITDPPYPKEFLPVYGALAKVAAHCLKPGGSLLVMVGQSYLPDVLKALTVDGLTYHWTLAYLTPGGQAPQIWPRKVNTFWKPVLWFVKGKYQGDWIGDVIKTEVNANDKRFHEWGQSEFGMATLIERFTLPGQMILDPFLGGGTTAVVALKLGRRFIGIDQNKTAIQTTKARVSA